MAGGVPRILALSQQVVDKIAAGEVIQRPYSAVKELIENSVDAGATQITITVKATAAFIQVQDNGKGIHPEDLNVICRRFNTSKLREFEDLKKMSTYGFRGEALSSITHVARVTITSQQANQSVSYRAEYCDGKMTSPAPNKVAGNAGTTITIEDLFYNVPQRLRALKSSGEEYSKIMEVVSKYALLHSGKVGFVCKRAGVHTPDVHTLPTSTLVDNVRKLYGTEVAKEFFEFQVAQEPEFKIHLGITNPNYSRKRGECILFINGRLVESTLLKRTCDACYQECLPKGMHPFIVLKLDLPMDSVDVNIHPTKKEVAFLREEEICIALTSALRDKLLSGSVSRTFETSRLASSAATTTTTRLASSAATTTTTTTMPQKEDAMLSRTKTPPSKQVRTDSRAFSGGLERFLVAKTTPSPHRALSFNNSQEEDDDELKSNKLIVSNGDALELESIHVLLHTVEMNGSKHVTNCLKRSVYVGVVDTDFSLLQYDTSLVLVHHSKLAEEIFYQRILRLFGRFEPLRIAPSIDLLELLDGREKCFALLMDKRALLHEYFHITLSDEGKLTALPRLFSGHVPLPRSLPMLFRTLAGAEDNDNGIDWSNELACFQVVARRIAVAYAQLPDFRPLIETSDMNNSVSVADRSTLQYVVKNVLVPLMKRNLIVPEAFTDPAQRIIIPLAKLEQLYKIFERC